MQSFAQRRRRSLHEAHGDDPGPPISTFITVTPVLVNKVIKSNRYSLRIEFS